jgi:aminomethyltransferase
MSSLAMARSALLRRSAVAATAPAKRAFAGGSTENLVKTALYDMHKELGGDMVPFAGYELPVLYKGDHGGVMKEHLWCRSEGKSALFDVSHMGQVSPFSPLFFCASGAIQVMSCMLFC